MSVKKRGDTTATVGGIIAKPKCTYKKGVCNLHGKGATKHKKKSYVKVKKPDGTYFMRLVSKIEYRCDLDTSGDKKLKQSKLSFDNSLTQNGADDNSVEGGGCLMTSTEGQISSCDDEPGL